MPTLSRDSESAHHLIAVQSIVVGPGDYEISCAEYERVVMCPAWALGETFGPGRHRWLCPSPQFPAIAYFVRTAPVHVAFDMATLFVLPNGGESVRITAHGTLQARCGDVNTLIAQVVALPTDSLNEGILRSVARSVERMLARVLTRRVLKAGTPTAITDPSHLPAILAELVDSKPLLGAVNGVEVMHIDQLIIAADDGTDDDASGLPADNVLVAKQPVTSERAIAASGEIIARTTPSFGSAHPALADDITHPDLTAGLQTDDSEAPQPQGNTILGIGMSAIGTATHAEPAQSATGFSPGTRVLVPSLKQAATVLQLQRGYYELDLGNAGDTIWVPATGVIPE